MDGFDLLWRELWGIAGSFTMYATVSIFRFDLPLIQEMTSGSSRSLRQGFLLCLRDAEGRTGWGEASPLPGYSPDSSADVQQAVGDLHGMKLPDLPDFHALSCFESVRPPSLRFALEVALLRLWSIRADRAWPLLFRSDAISSVPCAGLMSGAPVGWPKARDALSEKGFSTVKVKVGRVELDEELNMILRLADSAPRMRWRLDANRGWTLEEARKVLDACAGLPIEFVEEPLADSRDYPELLSTSPLGLALDESLFSMNPHHLDLFPGLCAVVLKPTCLGGIVRSLDWAAAAHARGMQVILSACFESGCGIQALAELYALLPGPAVAAGLDTVSHLGADVVSPPVCIRQGRVEWDRQANGGPEVNQSMIMEWM